MSNKLIAILVVSMVLVVITVSVLTRENSDTIAQINANESTTQPADADSTATTLQTLVAQLNEMQKNKAQDDARINALEQKLASANTNNVDSQQIEQNILDKTLAQIKNMQETAHEALEKTKSSDNSMLNLKNLDQMFGDSSITANDVYLNDAAPPSQLSITNSKNNYQTIGTLVPLSDEQRKQLAAPQNIANAVAEDKKPDSKKTTVEPVYTIPQLAMDINAQAITSIIGKIPNAGNVRDAFFFKAMSSADVLTANGHNLPHIEGVIWEGTAVGDRTLGCVQGYVNKVSLVFPDGTIATTNVGGSGAAAKIGYIADKYGQACVRGKLISNASRLLFARISARAVEAAAQAEAAAQEKSIDSGDKTTTTVLNRSEYVKAKTAAGSMNELVQFVRDRMSDAFDAIYVEPGITLQIHLQQQVNFDFDKNGRKLVHSTARQGKNVYSD